MANRKDPIKELARWLAGNTWSYDRLEVAIGAVCEAKRRPGDPSLAVSLYEQAAAKRTSKGSEKVIVRVKRRPSRQMIVAR